jgi:hypothetical protein
VVDSPARVVRPPAYQTHFSRRFAVLVLSGRTIFTGTTFYRHDIFTGTTFYRDDVLPGRRFTGLNLLSG